jgi:hypothetical protein
MDEDIQGPGAPQSDDAGQLQEQVRADAKQLELQYRQDPALQQEWLRQNRLIYGGLIIGGVYIVQPFIGAPSLDLPATVSVVALALAIPLLIAIVMVNEQEAFRHRAARSRVVEATTVLAELLAFVGIAAAFWHMLWVAGVVLVLSSLVAVLVHSAGWTRLELPRV